MLMNSFLYNKRLKEWSEAEVREEIKKIISLLCLSDRNNRIPQGSLKTIKGYLSKIPLGNFYQ